MDFANNNRVGTRLTGIAFVILLHLFAIYALSTGLVHKVVKLVAQPVMTSIIEEVATTSPPPVADPPISRKSPPPSPRKSSAPPPQRKAAPPLRSQPPKVHAPAEPLQDATVAVVTAPSPSAEPAPPASPKHTETDMAQPAKKQVRVPAVVDARNCEKPEYPISALRDEEEGTVILSFLIGVDGRVLDAKVEKTSGFVDLDKAAIAGLSRCRFTPQTVDGKPEQSWTKMRYVWRLEES